MVAKAREIEIPPGSELARLIDESEAFPVYLVKDGARYRLDRAGTDDASDAIKPPGLEEEDEEATLSRFVGAWKHLDVEKLKEELRRAREEGSRPTDWPGLAR